MTASTSEAIETEVSVEQSYDWCYRVARGSGSSFYRSFWLLNEEARRSMFALYAFSRITDDLGDEDRPEPIKRRALHLWRTEMFSELSGAGSGLIRVASEALNVKSSATEEEARGLVDQYEELWPALADTVEQFEIPRSLLEDVISGVEFDLEPVRISDWKKLDSYCYHVASAVGLACTRIWQASDELNQQAAIDCGIAFQLTNILRDLAEDARRGRIYLPLQALEEYGCSSDAWLLGRPDGRWQELVRFTINRASQLFDQGWQVSDALPGDGARMFSLMWHSYRRLLSKIEANVPRLWEEPRIGLSRWEKIRLVVAHFMPWNSRGLRREASLRRATHA